MTADERGPTHHEGVSTVPVIVTSVPRIVGFLKTSTGAGRAPASAWSIRVDAGLLTVAVAALVRQTVMHRAQLEKFIRAEVPLDECAPLATAWLEAAETYARLISPSGAAGNDYGVVDALTEAWLGDSRLGNRSRS